MMNRAKSAACRPPESSEANRASGGNVMLAPKNSTVPLPCSCTRSNSVRTNCSAA